MISVSDKRYIIQLNLKCPVHSILLLLNFISELLEDAVEEMSEDLALPIAIVLIVGFLGNK